MGESVSGRPRVPVPALGTAAASANEMSNVERETLPVDVLLVGGGPACLSCGIHLMTLIERFNANGPIEKLEKPSVLIIEKASALGCHTLSGAVLDPRALSERSDAMAASHGGAATTRQAINVASG